MDSPKPVVGLGLWLSSPSGAIKQLPAVNLLHITKQEELADEKAMLMGEEQVKEEVVMPASTLPQVSPYIIIPIWISLSGGLIIFNKWILTTKGFSFPMFLTAYHMVVAIIGTHILRYTTNLLDSANQPLPTRVWTRAILPTAILYAFSLVLSNIAYVHLSVPFIQMIKASTPVLLQLISFATGLAKLDKVMGVILVFISLGCAIATSGELWFDTIGLTCQAGAVVAEAARLLVMQVMLRDIKLNPLVSLYYYAPTCLVFIAAALPFFEGIEPFLAISNIGWPILIVNGLMAFALNVSSVLLISSSGSLVSTLSGVVKDILLIVLSVVVLGAIVTGQQIFGYGIALVGLIAFRNKNNIEAWLESNAKPTGILSLDEENNVPASPSRLAALRTYFPPLFSPKIGAEEDDEAVGFLPLWVKGRPTEIHLNDESESKWRPAGRLARIRLAKRVGMVVLAVATFALGHFALTSLELGTVWREFWASEIVSSVGQPLVERGSSAAT